jgi:hypothetical protein
VHRPRYQRVEQRLQRYVVRFRIQGFEALSRITRTSPPLSPISVQPIKWVQRVEKCLLEGSSGRVEGADELASTSESRSCTVRGISVSSNA